MFSNEGDVAFNEYRKMKKISVVETADRHNGVKLAMADGNNKIAVNL